MVTWSLAPIHIPRMLATQSTRQVATCALVTGAETLPLKFLTTAYYGNRHLRVAYAVDHILRRGQDARHIHIGLHALMLFGFLQLGYARRHVVQALPQGAGRLGADKVHIENC